ncbi:MAG: hypothetical protein ABR595_08900 [Psychroflexus sp.]
MYIAFALIHESIHAEIFERSIESGLLISINGYGGYAFSNFPNPSNSTGYEIFNLLMQYYQSLGDGEDEWTHEAFNVLDFCQEIKQNLIEINNWLDGDNSFEQYIINEGTFSSLEEFYEYFSWAGLQATQEYQNLSPAEQSKVQYAIQLINNF